MRRTLGLRWLLFIGTVLLLALGLRDARGRSKTSTLPTAESLSPKPAPTPPITERADTPPNSIVSTAEQRLLFRVAILYETLLIMIMIAVSYRVWDQQDPIIAYAPLPILEWGFIGGVSAILFRAAYRRGFERVEMDLATWILVKPLIGAVMGAIVYFIAVSGLLALSGKSDIPQNTFVNVLAFIAGFSDRFSIGLFRRFMVNVLREASHEREHTKRDAEGKEHEQTMR